VTQLSTSRHVVALTFDGGSGAQGAPAILAALAAANVKATFFLTGDFVRRNPLVVAAIVRAGHVIGNHTMTHPQLTTVSAAVARDEITDAAALIQHATGTSPRPWFRFPYGAYDQRSLTLVHALGYGAIGWTVDTLGWKGKTAGTSRDVVTRVLHGLRPGEIVLMHLGANPDDGTTYDAAALPSVIAALRSAGYEFVPLTTSTQWGLSSSSRVPFASYP
jgi:peptidoglycan/xylan/chitin deacetylase (PgdA/CDA1 family)